MENQNPRFVAVVSILDELVSPMADEITHDDGFAHYRLNDSFSQFYCSVYLRWTYVNAWKLGLMGIQLSLVERDGHFVHNYDVTDFTDVAIRAFVVRKLNIADVYYQPSFF